MEFETFGNKEYFEWQLGYNSTNDSATHIGVGVYPILCIDISLYKFVLSIGIKSRKIWDSLQKK